MASVLLLPVEASFEIGELIVDETFRFLKSFAEMLIKEYIKDPLYAVNIIICVCIVILYYLLVIEKVRRIDDFIRVALDIYTLVARSFVHLTLQIYTLVIVFSTDFAKGLLTGILRALKGAIKLPKFKLDKFKKL